jgi:hypothetical protein
MNDDVARRGQQSAPLEVRNSVHIVKADVQTSVDAIGRTVALDD